jgi:hypothetical protein
MKLVGAGAPLGYRLRGKTAIRRGLSAGWRLMASNIKARPQEEKVPEKEPPETAPDSPLLDLSEVTRQPDKIYGRDTAN